MHIARFAVAALLAAVLPAGANDTLATMGAGGLAPLKSSAIVMESEDLEISVHQVSVRYLFRNRTSRDIHVTVAFPLPELSGGLVANSPVQIPSKDPVNFMDFRVLVDGRGVTPKLESRAFIDQTEITGDLRRLGLPVSPLDQSTKDRLAKAPASEQSRFRKNLWVDCSLTNDGKCLPMWSARVQFYWTQNFPANQTVEVRHTYSPIVGGSYFVSDNDGSRQVQPYCGTADTLEQIRKQKAAHPARDRDSPALFERRIQYILTTANNWSGPIRSFRLAVTSDAPDDTVATCFEGLKRVAPTRYELNRSNFHPDKELDLLILQPAN